RLRLPRSSSARVKYITRRNVHSDLTFALAPEIAPMAAGGTGGTMTTGTAAAMVVSAVTTAVMNVDISPDGATGSVSLATPNDAAAPSRIDVAASTVAVGPCVLRVIVRVAGSPSL